MTERLRYAMESALTEGERADAKRRYGDETMRRGAEEFDFGDGTVLVWPRCEITGCPNNVCLRMSNSLCYQHGIEFGEFTKEEFEAERRAYHGENGNGAHNHRDGQSTSEPQEFS